MSKVLVTGGAGFVGRSVSSKLEEAGHSVRVLLNPSQKSPDFPPGTPVEVALSDLADRRGVRAALVGVQDVVHLAGAEAKGEEEALVQTEDLGTRALVEAASDAGIRRIIYLSQLNASRASAFPVFRWKAVAEDHIKSSGIPFTILRSGVVFGPGDRFTTALAMTIGAIPFLFLIPGNGETLLQPLWVEDLATCILWALADQGLSNRVVSVGGPEFLSFRQVLRIIMEKMGAHRLLVPTRPPYLRAAVSTFSRLLPFFPLTTFWVDYLAVNRTSSLDSLPRLFGLKPARFDTRLEYLKGVHWGFHLFQKQFQGRNGT